MLLKLDYANFDVSRLFCSKVIKEKPLGGRPLSKGRVNFLLKGVLSTRPSAFRTFCLYFRFCASTRVHANAHAHTLCRGFHKVAKEIIRIATMVSCFLPAE